MNMSLIDLRRTFQENQPKPKPANANIQPQHEVKILEVILVDTYGDSRAQAELWLAQYFDKGFEIAATMSVSGSEEHSSQRWGRGFIILKRKPDCQTTERDKTIEAVPWCTSENEAGCQHDADCLWCNY
jgi:hypothetical protein